MRFSIILITGSTPCSLISPMQIFTVTAGVSTVGGASKAGDSFLPYCVSDQIDCEPCEVSCTHAFTQCTYKNGQSSWCTLNTTWHRESRLPPTFCILLFCKNPTLKLSLPNNISRDHRRGLSCSYWIVLSETGRKRKNAGIKILDEEHGVLPAHAVLLPSPSRLELPAHHATQADKLPPLAPPRSDGASQPACCFFFQSLFVWQHEGLLHSSTSCVYIKLSPFFSSLDCFMHWIKAGNYCQGKLSSYTNPASFHIVAKVLLMQELKTQWQLVTELIHTYLCVTRTSQVTAWVRHVFRVAQSRVCSQDETLSTS